MILFEITARFAGFFILGWRVSNLRFVVDNAADRAALSGDGVDAMPLQNLQRDGRFVLWRSAGTHAQITCQFAALEYLSCIALIGSNLTEQSRWRVQAWRDADQVFDSDWQLAVPPQPLGSVAWGVIPLGISAFFLRSRLSMMWPEVFGATRVQIDLDDPLNTDGFLTASRLVAGLYWSPSVGDEFGGSWRWVNTGKRERLESGDVLTESGACYRVLTVSLPLMSASDRSVLADFMRRIGSKPCLLSLMPEALDTVQAADYTLWGVLPMSWESRYPSYQRWATTFDFEEA